MEGAGKAAEVGQAEYREGTTRARGGLLSIFADTGECRYGGVRKEEVPERQDLRHTALFLGTLTHVHKQKTERHDG